MTYRRQHLEQRYTNLIVSATQAISILKHKNDIYVISKIAIRPSRVALPLAYMHYYLYVRLAPTRKAGLKRNTRMLWFCRNICHDHSDWASYRAVVFSLLCTATHYSNQLLPNDPHLKLEKSMFNTAVYIKYLLGTFKKRHHLVSCSKQYSQLSST